MGSVRVWSMEPVCKTGTPHVGSNPTSPTIGENVMWKSRIHPEQRYKMNGQCLAFANGMINNKNFYEIYKKDAPIKFKVNSLYFMNDDGEYGVCDYAGHFIIWNEDEMELVKLKYRNLIERPKLSKNSKVLLIAYEKGYRVNDGEVISPFSGNPRKLHLDTRGYPRFSVRVRNNGCWQTEDVLVHRLAAYQKYGEKIFEPGIEVRHLNNDRLNNLFHNLDIGTPHQNSMDRPEERRFKESIDASTHLRKFTDREVRQIRRDHALHRSYAYVMNKWEITSKGTLHYILNNNYVTVVKGEEEKDHPIIKAIKDMWENFKWCFEKIFMYM